MSVENLTLDLLIYKNMNKTYFKDLSERAKIILDNNFIFICHMSFTNVTATIFMAR